MKISDLKTLEHNPRAITQEALGKLAESIKRNSKFMPLRPIVIDDAGNVLGGNQRLRAIRDILGMDEVPDSWVVRASDLSEQERREFVLTDNVQSGDWDVDLLREHWMDVDLDGLGVPFDVEVESEIPDENKAIDEQAFSETQHECPKCGFKW